MRAVWVLLYCDVMSMLADPGELATSIEDIVSLG